MKSSSYTIPDTPFLQNAASPKWNFNPYSLDSDTRGTSEDDGTYYLLPYWMGRYYGFLSEATS